MIGVRKILSRISKAFTGKSSSVEEQKVVQLKKRRFSKRQKPIAKSEKGEEVVKPKVYMMICSRIDQKPIYGDPYIFTRRKDANADSNQIHSNQSSMKELSGYQVSFCSKPPSPGLIILCDYLTEKKSV